MTREEQIVEAAKAKEKETGFCELVKNPVSRGVNSAYGIGFLEGAEWADKHPDLYSVTRKAVEREREYMIDKFCEFMQSCEGYVVSGEKCNYENFMKFMNAQTQNLEE